MTQYRFPVKQKSLFLFLLLLSHAFATAQQAGTKHPAAADSKFARTGNRQSGAPGDSAAYSEFRFRSNVPEVNDLVRNGKYSQAAEKLRYVIEDARKKKGHGTEIRTMITLASLFELQERYSEMRDILVQALETASKRSMPEELALVQLNLARAESRLNNYGVSIDHYLQVTPYYLSVNNVHALSNAYSNLGNAYWQVKKYNEALAVLQKARQLRVQQNDQVGLLTVYLSLAHVQLDMLAYDSATFYADTCAALGIRLGLTSGLKDTYKIKAEVAARRNDYAGAYKFMQQHSVWKDSSYRFDRDAFLQKQAFILKAQYTDSLLRVKNSEIAVQRSYKQLIALIALALLVYGALLWRRGKDKQQQIDLLKKEMEEARPAEEPAAVAFHEEMVEKMQVLNKEVFDLKQQLNRQVQMDIDQLKARLLRTINQQDHYWTEFLLFFSKIYPDFFERLKKEFPELTQNELRICALMKLNLGTQDMSNVLNITIESVRKARYRIYKKMGLTSDQEFADFMLMR